MLLCVLFFKVLNLEQHFPLHEILLPHSVNLLKSTFYHSAAIPPSCPE